jgi:hypothetical protein
MELKKTTREYRAVVAVERDGQRQGGVRMYGAWVVVK